MLFNFCYRGGLDLLPFHFLNKTKNDSQKFNKKQNNLIMDQGSYSSSTQGVMEHLKKIKPYDGYSIEMKTQSSSIKLVRLLRRNVPLTDNFFLDLYYDQHHTKYVVGILTNPDPRNQTTQARVLIEPDGTPIRDKNVNIITISSYRPNATRSTTNNNNNNNNDATNNNNMLFTEEQKQRMMYQFMYVVGSLVIARVVLTAFIGLYILALPILLFIMMQQCPSPSSFDAKKELKRILRGYHLPEDHPDKPKGFVMETLARVQATVATELATLPGYDITTYNMMGAAILQIVYVPSLQYNFYWIGAFQNWYFLYSQQITDNNNSNNNNINYNRRG